MNKILVVLASLALLVFPLTADASTHSWDFSGTGYCWGGETVNVDWWLTNAAPLPYTIVKSSNPSVIPVGTVVPGNRGYQIFRQAIHYTKWPLHSSHSSPP